MPAPPTAPAPPPPPPDSLPQDPGVPPGKVLVLGAGVVGVQAAKMAAGLGAHVTIMDIDMNRLRRVNDIMPNHVVTEFSSEYNIR